MESLFRKYLNYPTLVSDCEYYSPNEQLMGIAIAMSLLPFFSNFHVIYRGGYNVRRRLAYDVPE